MLDSSMQIDEIERWLREDDPGRLDQLWRTADECRRRNVGDEIHLRALVEASNHCVRSCAYCGLRAPRAGLPRYRMTEDEVLACAHEAVRLRFGTVVIQTGEDYEITREWMSGIIRRIVRETPLAVTLSLGERPDEDLAAWREAGAERYLLKFETSDRVLYDLIHPSLPGRRSDRFAILRELKRLGYEAGGGAMVGVPGQTFRTLAEDIDLFRKMDLDMVGVGPFIPSPATPLGSGEVVPEVDPDDQVPNDELTACKAVALTRLVRPDANLPSTTALATVNSEHGREHGLRRGANVLMPNSTPLEYRRLYEIYPNKVSANEDRIPSRERLEEFAASLGRTLGVGKGGRRRA